MSKLFVNKISKTMIGLSFLFSLFLPTLFVKADSEGANELWMRQVDLGSNFETYPIKMVKDSSGNLYIAGYAKDKIAGNYDFLIMKYDSHGSTMWIKRYDESVYDVPSDIAIDKLGQVYVTGVSKDSHGNNDFATIKYDVNGNMLWAKKYDGSGFGWGNDVPAALKIDNLGNVYVAGYSTIYSQPSNPIEKFATIKYDPNGNIVWLRTYSYGINDRATKLEIGGDYIVVAGTSWHSANLDFAVIKYDFDGNQLWTSRFDNGGQDNVTGVAIDKDDDIILTGWSYVDDGNGRVNQDFATVKFDTLGNQKWASFFDNGSNSIPSMIRVNDDGNIYIAGVSAANQIDLIKYATSGQQLWSKIVTDGQYVNGLSVDNFGNIYVGGTSASGSNDYLVLKWDSNGNELWKTMFQNGGIEQLLSLELKNPYGFVATGVSCDSSWQNCQITTLGYSEILNFDPPTSIILNGISHSPDYFSSSVQVALTSSAFDVKSIDHSLDSGATWCSSTAFNLSDDGVYSIWYRSVDNEGNVEVMQTQTFVIDKTPPSLEILDIPSENTLGIPIAVNFSASDNFSGIASMSGTLDGNPVADGTTLHNLDVGSHTLLVTGVDYAGNTTTKQVTFTVIYKFSGFQSPVKADGSGIYNLGRSLPLRFDLTNAGGDSILSAIVHLAVTNVQNGIVGNTPITLSTMVNDSGNLFNVSGNQYKYNLNTGLLSPGTWEIKATLDDGKSYAVLVSVR